MIINTDDYVSIPEAAAIVGCSSENFAHFAKIGAIPDPLIFKRRRYYRRDAIEAWKVEYHERIRRKPRPRN